MLTTRLIYVQIHKFCTLANGPLKEGIRAVLTDESFKIHSLIAKSVHKTAEAVAKWMETESNIKEAEVFEEKLVLLLNNCFADFEANKSQKVKREMMWTKFHKIRTSEEYRVLWHPFLQLVGITEMSTIFCQCVGEHVLKELAELQFPLIDKITSQSKPSELTCEETYGLRYAAGYVPRSLKKRLSKSTNPLKHELLLCLESLLITDQEDIMDDSKQWIDLIDRGGLAKVTNDCYELFVAMEKELRKHLSVDKAPKLTNREAIKQEIIENEVVQFFWSIISGEWEEESSGVLLDMIAAEWLKIRRFSFAGAWMEKYKREKKLTTQKSKGIRKQLAASKS